MSNAARAAIGLGAIALAVVLFVVLSDGGDDPGPAGTTTTERSESAGDRQDRPDKPEEPEPATLVVRGGEPVGGVAELAFTKGERIRFAVESDVADHVHLHGYDVFEDVSAGGRVEFDLPASIEGVFEVELEDRAVPLAEITVSPG